MKIKSVDKKPYRNIFIVVISVIMFLLVGFTSYAYFTVKKYQETISPGVKVSGVDLSGKTKEQAFKLLSERQKSIQKNNKITIRAEGKSYYIQYSDLNIEYNIKSTLDEVYSYGKEGNIFKKYFYIKKAKERTFAPKFTYDEKKMKNIIDGISKNVNKEPKDAKINFTNAGGIEIIPEVQGKKLLADKLEKEIKEKIEKNNGEDFNLDAPLQVAKPKATKEKLKQIDTLLATFSTSYRSSSYARATNVKLSTESINGTLIMPGEVFSFNDVVGRRTAEKGYMAAGVIVGNKLESGLGGGVCQVSSTLYNVVLKTGLSSVERAHHSFPSSYVPYGMDATVDYGNIDYKFKNTFKYPIYIVGHTGGRVVTFNIYSNKSLKNRTYFLENNIYQTLQASSQTKDDPNLEEGKTEQIQPAHTGYKVKVYRNIYENGNLVKKELVSDDFYRPVNGIVKKGTKKPEKKPEENPKPNTKPSEEPSKPNAETPKQEEVPEKPVDTTKTGTKPANQSTNNTKTN